MMVELLAGAMIGQALGFEATANDNGDGGPPTGRVLTGHRSRPVWS